MHIVFLYTFSSAKIPGRAIYLHIVARAQRMGGLRVLGLVGEKPTLRLAETPVFRTETGIHF